MQVGGTAAISNSTISANSAALHGGGLGNAGALNLTNSTVSGNSAGTVGGGIINFNLSTLTVTNATISGNSAAANGGGINAAPFGGIGTETLVNTIVAGNSAPVGADLQGTIETSTNVLTGDPTGILVPGGVADNGGPTQTIALALVAGNPAIDTAISATCAAAPVSSLDQRGLPRPAACDIGAYEAQPPTVAAHADVTAPATSAAGAVVTYTPPAGTDEQGGAAAVACVPPSGSTFPVGSTTVTCTATDAVGHTATGTFAVVVGALAEPSLPDAAMAIPNPAGSWVALGFGALLIGSLAGLAFVNARGVVRRHR
jgi:hypothetical protein